MDFTCPVFSQPCLKEKCVGYNAFTKEAFKDVQMERYIPIDDLNFYRNLSQAELNTRFNRIVSITRECKILGTIIEKIEEIDHAVPNVTQGYY